MLGSQYNYVISEKWVDMLWKHPMLINYNPCDQEETDARQFRGVRRLKWGVTITYCLMSQKVGGGGGGGVTCPRSPPASYSPYSPLLAYPPVHVQALIKKGSRNIPYWTLISNWDIIILVGLYYMILISGLHLVLVRYYYKLFIMYVHVI